MSVNEPLPMNKRVAAVVILAMVCIVAYGFSKGWFGSASSSPETEGTKVSVSQPLDKEGVSKDVAQGTEVTKSPAKSAVD